MCKVVFHFTATLDLALAFKRQRVSPSYLQKQTPVCLLTNTHPSPIHSGIHIYLLVRSAKIHEQELNTATTQFLKKGHREVMAVVTLRQTDYSKNCF